MPRRWGSAQTAGLNLFTCQFYFQENFTLLHTFAPKYRFFRYTSGYFDKLVCFPKILYSCSKIQQLNNPFLNFFDWPINFDFPKIIFIFQKIILISKLAAFPEKLFGIGVFFWAQISEKVIRKVCTWNTSISSKSVSWIFCVLENSWCLFFYLWCHERV